MVNLKEGLFLFCKRLGWVHMHCLFPGCPHFPLFSISLNYALLCCCCCCCCCPSSSSSSSSSSSMNCKLPFSLPLFFKDLSRNRERERERFSSLWLPLFLGFFEFFVCLFYYPFCGFPLVVHWSFLASIVFRFFFVGIALFFFLCLSLLYVFVAICGYLVITKN